jgi:phosphoribosyl-dephospho-CoA transferase
MIATSLRPHDLVHIEMRGEWFVFDEADKVALEELQRTPLVVIRRATARDGRVPIGVRGRNRSARYAGWMDPQAIRRIDQPEDLLSHGTASGPAAVEALWQLADRWRMLKWAWGPTGSVGFTLASGKPATNAVSDLDIVIRFAQRISPKQASDLLDSCDGLSAAVDVQGETQLGAFSVAEFARGNGCLLKTMSGPRLVGCPWRDGTQ